MKHRLAVFIGAGLVAQSLVAPSAEAHFVLTSPVSWMSQDSFGSPQKAGPCGDEGGGTISNKITTYQQGETITVTIDEKIFHPGHYRIALSVKDRSELPPDPKVTAAATPCGSTVIQNPPVFPVLADGVFAHTQMLNGPQSIKITLPKNVTCTKCTLQIIEFMSNHQLNNPGGCYYHHCADLAIQAPSGTGGSGGAGATSGAGGTASSTSTTSGTGGANATGSGGSSGVGTGAAPGSTGTGSAAAAPAASSGCALSGGAGEANALWLAAAVALAASRRRRS